MKKLIKSTTSVVILIALSLTAFSQTSASKTAKIKTLLELSGSSNLVNNMLDQMSTSLSTSKSKSATDFFEAFKEELKKEDIMLQIIPIYEKYYSETDLDGLIAFYKTDLGKKMTSNLPMIMKESMQVGRFGGKLLRREQCLNSKSKKKKRKILKLKMRVNTRIFFCNIYPTNPDKPVISSDY